MNIMRNLILSIVCLTAIAAYAAGIPAMDVTVSDASGKLVYRGKTTANGTFATGTLEPGNYVIQLKSNSSLKGNTFALVASAGKKKTVAEAVPGEKFTGGGVAMRLEVGKGLNITGQVAQGNIATGGSASGNAKVKVVNGKRYIWVTGGTGSNLGGRWVEEGSPEALNLSRMNAQGVQNMQDRAMVNGGPGQ